MRTIQMKFVWLLMLAWLFVPLPLTDANASRMNMQGVYKLLKSGNSELVRALALGEREILLATISMNRGKTKKALSFLQADVVKKNRLAALIRAEAYRRQSVQAADRAGRYAHAVNDDIGVLKKARITTGLDETNRRLDAFIASANRAKPTALRASAYKHVASKPVVVVRRPASVTPVQKVVVQSQPVQPKPVQPKPVQSKPVVIALPRPVVEAERPVVVNVVESKPVKLKLAKLRPIESFPIKERGGRANVAKPKAVKAKQATASSVKKTASSHKRASSIMIKQSARAALESWRKDWESLNSDAYLGHYHQSFKTLKHDYKSWSKYKRRVNGKKSYIKVALSNIKIIPSTEVSQEGEAALVIFNQRYQ